MSTDTTHLKALLVSAWAKVDDLSADNARAERDVAEALRQKGEALAKVDAMREDVMVARENAAAVINGWKGTTNVDVLMDNLHAILAGLARALGEEEKP